MLTNALYENTLQVGGSPVDLKEKGELLVQGLQKSMVHIDLLTSLAQSRIAYRAMETGKKNLQAKDLLVGAPEFILQTLVEMHEKDLNITPFIKQVYLESKVVRQTLDLGTPYVETRDRGWMSFYMRVSAERGLYALAESYDNFTAFAVQHLNRLFCDLFSTGAIDNVRTMLGRMDDVFDKTFPLKPVCDAYKTILSTEGVDLEGLAAAVKVVEEHGDVVDITVRRDCQALRETCQQSRAWISQRSVDAAFAAKLEKVNTDSGVAWTPIRGKATPMITIMLESGKWGKIRSSLNHLLAGTSDSFKATYASTIRVVSDKVETSAKNMRNAQLYAYWDALLPACELLGDAFRGILPPPGTDPTKHTCPVPHSRVLKLFTSQQVKTTLATCEELNLNTLLVDSDLGEHTASIELLGRYRQMFEDLANAVDVMENPWRIDIHLSEVSEFMRVTQELNITETREEADAQPAHPLLGGFPLAKYVHALTPLLIKITRKANDVVNSYAADHKWFGTFTTRVFKAQVPEDMGDNLDPVLKCWPQQIPAAEDVDDHSERLRRCVALLGSTPRPQKFSTQRSILLLCPSWKIASARQAKFKHVKEFGEKVFTDRMTQLVAVGKLIDSARAVTKQVTTDEDFLAKFDAFWVGDAYATQKQMVSVFDNMASLLTEAIDGVVPIAEAAPSFDDILHKEPVQSEQVMAIVNADAAKALKNSWMSLVNKLELPNQLVEVCNSWKMGILAEALEVFHTDTDDKLQAIRDKVATFIGISSIFRPLKAAQMRKDTIKQAVDSIEIIGGDVGPKLKMMMQQAARDM